MKQKHSLLMTLFKKEQLKHFTAGIVILCACVSCTESATPNLSQPQAPVAPIQNPEPEEPVIDDPVLKVFTETGKTGMQVTYMPSSIPSNTGVEALEHVYGELMACVGLSSIEPPNLLITDDSSLFFTREDGTDIRGFYDLEKSTAVIEADDVDSALGNQYWWTRHAMIEYLIDTHHLNPDSAVSPFLQCHWQQ
jgi:hypothetical protein